MLTLEGNQGRPKRIGRVSEANGRCLTASSRPREAPSPAAALLWQQAVGMRTQTLAPISVLLKMHRAACSALDITLLLLVTPGRAGMSDPYSQARKPVKLKIP